MYVTGFMAAGIYPASINPLTADAAYNRVFIFISTLNTIF